MKINVASTHVMALCDDHPSISVASKSFNQAISNILAHYSILTGTAHKVYGRDWLSPWCHTSTNCYMDVNRDRSLSDDTISHITNMLDAFEMRVWRSKLRVS